MASELPEFQALKNDVVLDMIFSLLKAPDLLRCRKVSRKWNIGATSFLKRRTVYLKSIGWDARKYDELFQVIQSSQDFPFCGFALRFDGSWRENPLNTLSAKKFFKKFGHSFQHLSLHCESICSRDLAKLLSSFLPNIRTIELEKFSIRRECKGQRIHKALSNLTLAALRRILIKARDRSGYDMPPILEADMTLLLRAATGLQKIEGNLRTCPKHEGILMAISTTNNFSKLSTLTLENNEQLSAEVFQSLASNAPSFLTQLTLDGTSKKERGMQRVLRTEFVDCVRAVLVASAEPLRSLIINRVPLPMNRLPTTFSRLTTLEFQRYSGHVPPGISSYYDKFPALQQVRLGLGFMSAEVLREKFWEEGTEWSSVVKLDLLGYVTQDGMKHLANTFPAVTHVAVHFEKFFDNKDHWPRALSSLRELPSLEKLEILDMFLGSSWRHYFLDEFLTGIPGNICSRFRDRPKIQLTEDFSEVMRPFGGIILLRGTKLKELVLHADWELWYYHGGGRPFMSKVSVGMPWK